MKKVMDFLKAHPMITWLVALIFSFSCVKLLRPADGNTLKLGLIRLLLFLSVCFLLYLVSGEKTFDSCTKTTGYVFKHSLLLLIVPAITFAAVIIGMFIDPDKVRSNWFPELLSTVFMCLCVGLFEEILFRAIINDAMLRQFREVKGIFPVIAVVSSVIFGAVHIVGADISQPIYFAQAVLKTASTGAMGLCLLFLYWKTRNLWAIALVHGLYDLLPSVGTALMDLDNGQFTGGASTYVGSDDGPGTVVLYSFQFVVTLAVAFWIWKKTMKDVDLDELRKNW